MNKIRIYLLFVVFGLMGIPVDSLAEAITFTQDRLSIETAGGVRHFSVEIAQTPAQQEHGFMHRKNIPADHGMLFIMSGDKIIDMWMKDTPHPLDMLFIDSHGRIVHIAANAVPNSTAIIRAGVPARAVLELPGGAAANAGITVGDRVIYSAFKP